MGLKIQCPAHYDEHECGKPSGHPDWHACAYGCGGWHKPTKSKLKCNPKREGKAPKQLQSGMIRLEEA